MAPVHSFSWFLTLVLAILPLALARPWIVTEDFHAVTITYGSDEYLYEDEPTAITSYQLISPTVTSMPEALSTITSVDELESVTEIWQLYPSGVGAPVSPYLSDEDSDFDSDSDSSIEHITVYVVPLTLTAPSSCSDQWTTTTAVTINPPEIVASALSHTAASTSFSTDTSSPFQSTTWAYEYFSLAPSQVPSASLSRLRENEYSSLAARGFCSNYRSDSCEYDTYYCSNTGTSSSDPYNHGHDDEDYYEGNWFFDPYWMGISPFALTMILLFGWIGVWLIAGFIEAWFRFRRLMLGWQTRRGLPVCWALTVLPLSLFLLFFFKRGYRARNLADAAILNEKWNDMSFGTKLALFFKWGFRVKYPDVLGAPPPRVTAGKMPNFDPNAPRNAPGTGLLAEQQQQQQPEMTGAGPDRAADPELGESAAAPVSREQAAGEAQHSTGVAGSQGEHHVNQDDEIGRAQ